MAEGLPFPLIRRLSQARSVEAALLSLEETNPKAAQNLWNRLASVVEQRSNAYVGNYGSWPIEIGAALFDRQRRMRWAGPFGLKQLDAFGVSLYT